MLGGLFWESLSSFPVRVIQGQALRRYLRLSRRIWIMSTALSSIALGPMSS